MYLHGFSNSVRAEAACGGFSPVFRALFGTSFATSNALNTSVV